MHTGVARYIRGDLAKDPAIKVICVGDKSRAILQRLYGKNILMVANEVSSRDSRIDCCITDSLSRLDVCHQLSWTLPSWPTRS